MTCFECDKTKLDKKLNRNWRYQGHTGSFDGHNLRHEVSATLTPSQLCRMQLSALLAECVAARKGGGPYCGTCNKPVRFEDLAQHINTKVHKDKLKEQSLTKQKQQSVMKMIEDWWRNHNQEGSTLPLEIRLTRSEVM